MIPEGFDAHPDAKYPWVINQGHFPEDLEEFRESAPDSGLKPDSSTRFHLGGYNRLTQQYAHQFYEDWIGRDFPRVLLMSTADPTPDYADLYAVNPENKRTSGAAAMERASMHVAGTLT